MRMDELDYMLPPERIATHPAEPRDSSRLMVVHPDRVEHRHFRDITEYLRPGDLLVVNETRVLPAKLALRRATGAAIQGLFLREIVAGTWEAMLRTRGKVSPGETLHAEGYTFELLARQGEGIWQIRVSPAEPAAQVLQKIGHIPLPPYIERRRKESGAPAETSRDRDWYQTTFAQPAGNSVAAPTAGLHFTPELLARLAAMGVQRAAVELEVGMGTFLPVETETLEAHPMHTEHYRISAATVAALRTARQEKRRIVAVGTTAVRTLEAAADQILKPQDSRLKAQDSAIAADTTLKIAPGFCFQLTDALITNFHLPKSTLMALVAAFLDRKPAVLNGAGPTTHTSSATLIPQTGLTRLKSLYTQAIQNSYRFYSYGDAMLIQP